MNTTTIRKISFTFSQACRKTFAHPRDAVLRARMAFWVVLISLAAELTSLPRAHKITSFKLRSAPVTAASETVVRLGQAIDSVLGIDLFVFRRSCWKRAMVLQRFLAIHGIDSQIKFGLRKESGGKMDGHAWLEHQGQPLLEDNSADYIVTFSLPVDSSLPDNSANYQKMRAPLRWLDSK